MARCLEEEVEAPRTRGRDEVDPDADEEEEGKAIPPLPDWERAGDAGRGMCEDDDDGTGRKVGVIGREEA